LNAESAADQMLNDVNAAIANLEESGDLLKREAAAASTRVDIDPEHQVQGSLQTRAKGKFWHTKSPSI